MTAVQKILRWLPVAAGVASIGVLFAPGFAELQGRDEADPPPIIAQPQSSDTQWPDTPQPDMPQPDTQGPDTTPAATPSVETVASLGVPPDGDAEASPELDPALDTLPGTTTNFGLSDPSLDCIIEPFEVVEIGSPVTGLIETIGAERGDNVEAGQILVELESGVERAAVELARVRSRMRGDVQSREVQLELGERREVRGDELFDENALSLDQREQLETDAEMARLELRQARENRELAQLELRQAIQALERRTIRSPIPGVVVERLMSPGEVVDEETILTIAQIDPLRVEVILPSAMFGTIRPGMRAAISPETGNKQVHLAAVTIVDRVIDAASGTFGVRLELANPDQSIPGGLHCRVRFLSE